MASISDPYTIKYLQIVALADDTGSEVELVECFDCIGGAMWAKYHYPKSPLVRSVAAAGNQIRYRLGPGMVPLDLVGSRFPAGISSVTVDDREIAVSYVGLGGGGVGASICRASAAGVLRSTCDQSGGGKIAGSTIWLPRMERVLIGVDDTDTPEAGATWTLAHNIARTVEDAESRYLSHTIVQLYPVAFRTKNCVATVCEFATANPARLIGNFRALLETYTLSGHTGMAVYCGFDPSGLRAFGWQVKQGQVSEDAVGEIREPRLHMVIRGRGIVGAIAAIPFYGRYEEALELCSG